MIFFNYSTGIHYTDKTVEWVVLRKSSKGTEKIREGSLPIPAGFFSQENAPAFPAEVLTEIRRNFRGIVTVSLPSSKLLMRIMELPSTDPHELKSMVELQIDQASPFPADQMTVSYETLHQSEDHSRVLAVAAPRKMVDELGNLFKAQNVYIRSLDSTLLAWWSLLAQGEIQCADRTVLILEEHTEFSMIILDNGIPVHFHSLELFHKMNHESVMKEIAEEVRFTLLSLETEYGHLPLNYILFWSQSAIPDLLCTILGQTCHADVLRYNLNSIPPLSEGLALRTSERRLHHVELVPHEWIELQRRKRIIRIASITSIAVLSLWVAVVAITGLVFSVQKAAYNRLCKEAEKYEAPAQAAQEARAEMLSLEKYADRSHSALECLREIVIALPETVEIGSFTYKKGDSVSLRGSSDFADSVYDFSSRLAASELFKGITDERSENRMVRERRTTVFSVTAELPKIETEEGQ